MSSTTEQSKRVAQNYIDTLNALDFDALPSFFTPDATWWVLGNPAYVSHGGWKSAKERIPSARAFGNFKPNFLTPYNMLAEGGKVVVESKTRAISVSSPDGPIYENDVLMSFELEGGKIKVLREYVDNHQIEAFMKAKMAEAASS